MYLAKSRCHGHHLPIKIYSDTIKTFIKMNLGTAAAENVSRSPQTNHHHDTHALPPAFIQKAHWHYTSVKRATLDADEDVIDFRRGLTAQQIQALKPIGTVAASRINEACQAYKDAYLGSVHDVHDIKDVTIFEHHHFPGTRNLGL